MEIAIISGKGGTGKSSISAAFATIGEELVLADCDVDAANLYLLFNPEIEAEQVYIGGQKAVLNPNLCTQCGLCIDYCRFDAIHSIEGKTIISEISCDGCHLCARVCPWNAISMVNSDKSHMYSGNFRNGKMVYGRLAPGEENSGKLVNLVRDKAKQLSKSNALQTIIIDGPPGIGCPVISSITGVDCVVIVTEPSISGLHDLKRAVGISSQFNLKTLVLINKFDLNKDMSIQIELYCKEAGIEIAGKLPFEPLVVEAMVNCRSIAEWAPDSEVSLKLKSIYKNICS
jgi:MinD superfamily P-loop ATPase